MLNIRYLWCCKTSSGTSVWQTQSHYTENTQMLMLEYSNLTPKTADETANVWHLNIDYNASCLIKNQIDMNELCRNCLLMFIEVCSQCFTCCQLNPRRHQRNVEQRYSTILSTSTLDRQLQLSLVISLTTCRGMFVSYLRVKFCLDKAMLSEKKKASKYSQCLNHSNYTTDLFFHIIPYTSVMDYRKRKNIVQGFESFQWSLTFN